MSNINNISIPEFDNFKLTPNNDLCKAIDTTRLMVEVLWGLKPAQSEIGESEYASKILIDGDFSLIMRYKREKNWNYHPACILSFEQDNSGNIYINQFQWTKDKHIWFRFHSSFRHIEYFIKLIEESFIKKWIYVEVKNFPEWLEWASYSSKAFWSYNILRWAIKRLNQEYKVEKK